MNELMAVTADPKTIRRLKVVVTESEIDEAVRCSSQHCMVSDAIKRDYGDRFKGIVTDKEATAFTDRKTNVRYKFPLTVLARQCLLQFDAGEHVEPFTFFLKNPIVRQRKTRIQPGAAKKGEKTPRLVGGTCLGTSGAISGAKDPERRKTRGIDRFFGKRVFSAELAELKRRLLGAEEATL